MTRRLSTPARQHAEALAAFPSTLQVTGRTENYHYFNGVEALGKMQSWVREMIDEAFDRKMNSFVKQSLPELGASFGG